MNPKRILISGGGIAGLFVPSKRSRPWLRRLTIQLLFSKPLIGIGLRSFGARSVLVGRRD